MKNSDQNPAIEKFFSGYNCSQAVLYSACDRLAFDSNTALKISCGFGAGMGREQEVCGAVSGGIMALGLKFGRGERDDPAKTDATYAQTRSFITAFKERHGSVNCRDLIKCDLMTPEGQTYFKENDLLRRTCARCVGTAIELLEAAF